MDTTYPAAGGDRQIDRPIRHKAAAFPVVLASAFATVVLMNLVHEAGHALAGKALGYEVLARTNHVAVVGGQCAAWRTRS